MEARIARQTEIHPDLTLRLDCALAFLERHLPAEMARRAGLRGCVAGARIIALGPDGSVYPCSQLVAPRLRAGNLLEADPAQIWRESPVLRKYRNLRAGRSFRQTLCGACLAVERCGGCLALSDNGLGADPGCPEPLLPPLSTLGPDGRVADLRRYLDSQHTISVAEYMDRYGVGQKRAVSELRRFPGLILIEREGSGKRKCTGRRKVDRYELPGHDLVGDIQELIGCTTAGFPYATQDEIEEWTGLTAARAGYPAWLNEPELRDDPTRPSMGQRRRR
jgi:radical SAM protein with 4Fe4S-binding SPASM domain